MFKESRENPKPNIRVTDINTQLELFKKDPKEFLNSLAVSSAYDWKEVNRKIWILLQKLDVSSIKEDGRPRFKITPTTEELINLLDEELKKKEAA